MKNDIYQKAIYLHWMKFILEFPKILKNTNRVYTENEKLNY